MMYVCMYVVIVASRKIERTKVKGIDFFSSSFSCSLVLRYLGENVMCKVGRKEGGGGGIAVCLLRFSDKTLRKEGGG